MTTDHGPQDYKNKHKASGEGCPFTVLAVFVMLVVAVAWDKIKIKRK